VPQITILDGSTYCVCDERGDLGGGKLGFYSDDTRFLKRFVLTIDGTRPRLLTGGTTEHYAAAFFFTNPGRDGLRPNELSIRRERFVGRGLQDRVVIENHSHGVVAFQVGLELAADFADLFAIKGEEETYANARAAPPEREPQLNASGTELVFADADFPLRTDVRLSRPAELVDGVLVFRVELEPQASWELQVDVMPLEDREPDAADEVARQVADDRDRERASLAAWHLTVPALRTGWDELGHAYRRSVADLAALRLRGAGAGELPGAGMPWFMTVFGRDTIITCLQTQLLGPGLARTALRVLAELQATEDDPSIDAEPGKIVHELRRGKTALVWFSRYYGTVDATPLFLVLLSETWRWSGDDALVRELRGPALRALEWIDRHGDHDGDGFVEYARRAPNGIRNQGWKDSDAGVCFPDGSLVDPPVALAQVQGYVYDAKTRLAELARAVWGDDELAVRLEREAAELRARFDEAFRLADGTYALALDGAKNRVPTLASDLGHLLWSGILPEERIDGVVDALFRDELWAGWGIRTLAAGLPAYNPLVYHNGTVWPHDNSLIAAGLARAGRWDASRRIVRSMIEAAAAMDYRLPELFAGYARSQTPFPVAYPTASSPQAWAAGTPILLLQTLLGLEPDVESRTLRALAPPPPDWGEVELDGVTAFGRRWDVRGTTVHPA
jgi:glycogen debranching enzyme